MKILRRLSRKQMTRTTLWTLAMACLIVVFAATLARAMLNMNAALVNNPDLGIYLLDKNVSNATLLRDGETERDYLGQTPDGPKLYKMKKGDKWYIESTETLHAD